MSFVTLAALGPTGTAGADVLALELADLDTPQEPPGEPVRVLPGSSGEHQLQCAFGTEQRAQRFYDDQVLDHLNTKMIEFVRRMDMAFVATSDAGGECDCSLRAGPRGFIRVLDDSTIAYPEYRGNGVMASLGNISENARVGMLLIDFVNDLIGLHINGDARIVEDDEFQSGWPGHRVTFEIGRKPERWVVVDVVEAYIHCRKHIPRMVPVERDRAWGTDDPIPKGGDYFGAKGTARPWWKPGSIQLALPR